MILGSIMTSTALTFLSSPSGLAGCPLRSSLRGTLLVMLSGSVEEISTQQGISRGIFTSDVALKNKGFQSVLRKTGPRALTLNRDNFQMWRDSGFDMKAAQNILEAMYQTRWQKQAVQKQLKLQHEMNCLVKQCATADQLLLVIQQVADHMDPRTLVEAVVKVPKLPVQEPGHDGSPVVSDILENILQRLAVHFDSLSTWQLAAVMESLSRAGHRPEGDAASALRAQLEGDVGQGRVDAAGPAETAALMSACSRLSMGNEQLWEGLCEAALAQMAEMSPRDISKTMSAARNRPSVAADIIGPGVLLWVHAEQVVLSRMTEFEPSDLARVLLSLAGSGAAAGQQLRTATDVRLQSCWSTVPPNALVDFVRTCCIYLRRDSPEAQEPAVRSLLQHACNASAFAVTHMSTPQLEQILSALESSVSGTRRPDQDLPRVVAQLMGLVTDVVAIRGLQQQAGEPLRYAVSHGIRRQDSSSSSCRVPLLLARLSSHINAADQERVRSKVTKLLSLLQAQAEQLLGKSKLNAESASFLLQAYALVGQPSSLARVAQVSAPLFEQGASNLSISSAVGVLSALSGAHRQQNLATSGAPLQAAARALADRLSVEKLSERHKQDLRQALPDLSRKGLDLQGHVLLGMIR